MFSILYSWIPMRGSKVRGNNLGEGVGCRGDVQRLPGRWASMRKQSQIPLQPTEVELGLQVGVEFDNILDQTILCFIFCNLVQWCHLCYRSVKTVIKTIWHKCWRFWNIIFQLYLALVTIQTIYNLFLLKLVELIDSRSDTW